MLMTCAFPQQSNKESCTPLHAEAHSSEMRRYGVDTPSSRKKAGAGRKSGVRSPLPATPRPESEGDTVAPLMSPRVTVEADSQTQSIDESQVRNSPLFPLEKSADTSPLRLPSPAPLWTTRDTDDKEQSCEREQESVKAEEDFAAEQKPGRRNMGTQDEKVTASLRPSLSVLSDASEQPMKPLAFARSQRVVSILVSDDGQSSERTFNSPSQLLTFDDFITPDHSTKGSFEAVQKPLSRRAEADRVKQLARLKEAKRQRRLQATVIIQSWFRGVLSRRRTATLYERRRLAYRQQRLRELREEIKVSWAPIRIYRALQVTVPQVWTKRQKAKRAKVFLRFKHHCAESIQRVFRGYLARRLYRPLVLTRLQQRAKITALVLGWKTRRILKYRRIRALVVQLKEMMGLMSEGAAPSDLVHNINMQIPMLKRKLLGEFSRLFATGKWVERSPIISKHTPPRPDDMQRMATTQPMLFRPKNRDDMPVTSMHIDFSQVEDTAFLRTGKPIHTKFLRKNDRREPVKKAKPKLLPLEARSEDEEKRERSPFSPQMKRSLVSEQEELRQEDDKQTQPFLKRRSRAVSSQRLVWTARSRVDCWGHRTALPRSPPAQQIHSPRQVSQSPKRRKANSPKSPRMKPFSLASFDLSPSRKSILTARKSIDELETIFTELGRAHVFVSAYFAREDIVTHVPQFHPDSYFMTHYTEDIYPVRNRQETLETLEAHYNYLCSEADE